MIYGGAGDDSLSAGGNDDGGWQYLYGQTGDDTYRVSKLDGSVFVGFESAASGTADRVVFKDLTLDDITIDYHDYGADHANGNSLRLLWNDGEHSGELRTAQEGRFIETFEFADGTTLSSILVNDNRTILQGTDGDDILGGSTGPDTFVFADDWGTDTIVGFEDGVDLISFAENDAVDGFDDLSIKQDGADMVISYGGNYIFLKDVVVDRITDDDFLYSGFRGGYRCAEFPCRYRFTDESLDMRDQCRRF